MKRGLDIFGERPTAPFLRHVFKDGHSGWPANGDASALANPLLPRFFYFRCESGDAKHPIQEKFSSSTPHLWFHLTLTTQTELLQTQIRKPKLNPPWLLDHLYLLGPLKNILQQISWKDVREGGSALCCLVRWLDELLWNFGIPLWVYCALSWVRSIRSFSPLLGMRLG